MIPTTYGSPMIGTSTIGATPFVGTSTMAAPMTTMAAPAYTAPAYTAPAMSTLAPQVLEGGDGATADDAGSCPPSATHHGAGSREERAGAPDSDSGEVDGGATGPDIRDPRACSSTSDPGSCQAGRSDDPSGDRSPSACSASSDCGEAR